MIIGVVGFIGSGKNTVGEILVNEYSFIKLSFADSLKDAVSSIFMWPRHLLEGDTEESRLFREKVDPWWTVRFGYDVTPRLILQKMGTEACRNNISQNIWISALERRVQEYDNVVITDVRFENEFLFLKKMKGKIIRINRGTHPSNEELNKMHISERDWLRFDPNYIIDNEGSLDDLRVKVLNILTQEEKNNTIENYNL